MKECSKAIPRRLSQPNFINRYFVGDGIDIGGQPDPLALYRELFRGMRSVRTWDRADGDAQFLHGIADDAYDFAHSSHCLEHLRDPAEGLRNWLRVVRPRGYVIFTVPDEDLYEQGDFPSSFNPDHQWTFTIFKPRSWHARSLNILTLVTNLGPDAEVIKIELLDSTFRYELPRYDQTSTPVGECGIEVVLRKRPADEIRQGGRIPPQGEPSREMRIHLNQYRDDIRTLKRTNLAAPPFTNERPLGAS
jgi:SAM-dependent methyltransferase